MKREEALFALEFIKNIKDKVTLDKYDLGTIIDIAVDMVYDKPLDTEEEQHPVGIEVAIPQSLLSAIKGDIVRGANKTADDVKNGMPMDAEAEEEYTERFELKARG